MSPLHRILFLGAAFVAGVNADCYWPNGKLATKMVPCHGDDVMGTCCAEGWSCLANKACGNFADPRFDFALNNVYQRQACTDESWQSNQCPQYCTSTSAGAGAAVMYQCNSTHVCCDNGNNGSLCCDEEAQKFFIGTPQNLTAQFANFSIPSATAGSSSGGAASTVVSTVYPSSTSTSPAALADAQSAQQQSDSNRSLKLAIAIAIPIALLLALATGIITFFVLRKKNRRLDELENHVRVLNHTMTGGTNEKSGWITSSSDTKSPWYDTSPISQPPPTSGTSGRAELLDGKHEDAKELSGRHIGMALGGLMKGRFSGASSRTGVPTTHEKGRGVLDEHQTINKDKDGYYRPHPALRSDQKTGSYTQGPSPGEDIQSQYSIVPPYRSASSYRSEARTRTGLPDRERTGSPSNSNSNNLTQQSSNNNLRIYSGFDDRPESRTGADGIAIARPLDLSHSGNYGQLGSSPMARSRTNVHHQISDEDSEASPVTSYEDIGTLASVTSPFGGPQPFRSKFGSTPPKSAPRIPPMTSPNGALRRTNTDGVSPTEDQRDSPVRGPSRNGAGVGSSSGHRGISPIRSAVSRDGSFSKRNNGSSSRGSPTSKPLPQSPIYRTGEF